MSEHPTDPVSRRVLFSGRVQGVGFRYTTASVARDFEVTGFVRNLPDGKVELICEGSPDQIAGFVDAVRQTMSDYIGGVEDTEQPPTGAYQGFDVRF